MYQHLCAGAECPYCSFFAVGTDTKQDHALGDAACPGPAWWKWPDSTGATIKTYPKRLAPSTTIILIVGAMDNRMVLCQLRKDNQWWGFPGGSQKIGESILECAIREMKEETGLEVILLGATSVDSDPHRYAMCSYLDGVVQYTNMTFLAQLSDIYDTTRGINERCDEESLALRWVALHQLPDPFLLNHRWRFEQALAHTGPYIAVR